MVKERKDPRKKIVHIMIGVVIAVAIFYAGLGYANDYYRATDTARKAILGMDLAVSVVEEDGYYLISQEGEEVDKGIIFYPGGKVEESAYAPMLVELAKEGYEVYLVKMPAKLAIFGSNKADAIIEEHPEIKEWTMMGHSLGGAMAASFSADHDEEIDRLVLLAAYSTEDISEADIQVFSFYGSNDRVLNMESYEKYRDNLPEDTIEEIIEGGNHAYYGHYGEQDGDGEATITRSEQQQSVLDILLYSENL